MKISDTIVYVIWISDGDPYPPYLQELRPSNLAPMSWIISAHIANATFKLRFEKMVKMYLRICY